MTSHDAHADYPNVAQGEDTPQAHKPTLGEKISGKVEQLVGKATKNDQKVAEGELESTGQPEDQREDRRVFSQDASTDEKHRKAHLRSEEKHAQAHLRDSPHILPAPVEDSNVEARRGSDDLSGEKGPLGYDQAQEKEEVDHRHEDKHGVHGADIPPPPSSSNPYVLDSSTASDPTPAAAAGRRDHPIQVTNIPLPPSHTNSFAYDAEDEYEPERAHGGHGTTTPTQERGLGLGTNPYDAEHRKTSDAKADGEPNPLIPAPADDDKSAGYRAVGGLPTSKGVDHGHGHVGSGYTGLWEGGKGRNEDVPGPKKSQDILKDGQGMANKPGVGGATGIDAPGVGLGAGGVADRFIFSPPNVSPSAHADEVHSEDHVAHGRTEDTKSTPHGIVREHRPDAADNKSVKDKVAEHLPGTRAHAERKEEKAFVKDMTKDV